jgi:hypothetical protein
MRAVLSDASQTDETPVPEQPLQPEFFVYSDHRWQPPEFSENPDYPTGFRQIAQFVVGWFDLSVAKCGGSRPQPANA